MSVSVQEVAFATDVLPNIYEFHLYTREFHFPLQYSSSTVSNALPGLSPGLSHQTYQTTYTRFTPNNSEQRLHSPYYRGCWHGVSQCFLRGYRQRLVLPAIFFPSDSGLRAETLHPTRDVAASGISPIAQNSLLLPPVGVWTVFQFQCG